MLSLLLIAMAQCPEACCYVDPNADRTIDGYVTFPKAAVFAGNSPVTSSVGMAAYAPNGVATRHIIAPMADQTLRLYGRKRGSDQQSGIEATATEWVDGGIIFSVNAAVPCQSVPLFSVSDQRIGFGANVLPNCASAVTKEIGALVDESGMNDHVSLTCQPNYFVGVQGKLGENRINTLLDGGCDAVDQNNFCYATPAHRHGELTVFSSVKRLKGGWGIEYRNHTNDGTGHSRFFVDVWGGIGQRHLMIRSQFPSCPARVEVTTPQTQYYVYGADESTMLYAFDEHRWHYCDGSMWVHMDDRSACTGGG